MVQNSNFIEIECTYNVSNTNQTHLKLKSLFVILYELIFNWSREPVEFDCKDVISYNQNMLKPLLARWFYHRKKLNELFY